MTDDHCSTVRRPPNGGAGPAATTPKDELLIPMLGSPAVAGLARTLATERLHKWDCCRALDDVLLIIGELIANAVQETPGKEIRFQLSRDVQGLIIAVWDSSPRLPRPRPVVELTLDDLDLSEDSFDRNGGLGLPLVQALSAACGCTRDPMGGKWTWARVAQKETPSERGRPTRM